MVVLNLSDDPTTQSRTERTKMKTMSSLMTNKMTSMDPTAAMMKTLLTMKERLQKAMMMTMTGTITLKPALILKMAQEVKGAQIKLAMLTTMPTVILATKERNQVTRRTTMAL